MKVLICDEISKKGIDILRGVQSLEVDLRPGLTPEEFKSIIGRYEGVIVRSSTKITKEIIEAAAMLMVIGRAGVGYDNIDVEAASRRGIIVMNSPQGNSNTAAEHTISLLMALARNITAANSSMKKGEWTRSRFIGVEVMGKVLGVVGLGRIGTLVAKKALGLDMRVMAFDPYISSEMAERLGVELVELDQLLAAADFITIHTPMTRETTNLIGKREFELMKPGVRIINCARGGIINEAALRDAIVSGKVAGAALDVFSEEPPKDNPLIGLNNVTCTPHLGAYTEEAQEKVAVTISEQVADFFVTGQIRNAVNAPSVSIENLSKVKPYMDLAVKLGSFQAQLMEGGPKEIRIEYSGEAVTLEPKALTVSILKGLLQSFLQADVNIVNAPIIARNRGIKIVETSTTGNGDYPNLITIEVVTDKTQRIIAGTLIRDKEQRIVRIDQYRLEAPPEGYMLVFSNRDTPGVIGKIGTIMGNNSINIGAIHLCRTRPHDQAVCIVNVDSSIPENVLEEINSLPYIIYAKMVKL